MEDNIQESNTNENFPVNLNQESKHEEILLSKEEEIEPISNQNILGNNENEEIKEIKQESELKDIDKEIEIEIEQNKQKKNEENFNEEPIQILNNKEIKENNACSLPEQLLNIQKLIKKELSTRKMCKYI